MGRIRLQALRVRQRALANLETRQTTLRPCWLDTVSNVPPSPQTLVRPLPPKQTLTKVRTRTLPSPTDPTLSKPTQIIETQGQHHRHAQSQRSPKTTRKPSRLFAPMPITYEEDLLRQRFYRDHPWELARPRVLVETTGDSHASADWSRGLEQPNIPLSGESVVQRQLHLLQSVPDITESEAYDIARREFYLLRRQEQVQNRIAAEEARAMGAEFGPSRIEVGMGIENQHYDDWERWSRLQVVEMMQKMAAFEGGTAMPVEREALQEVASQETVNTGLTPEQPPSRASSGGLGSRVFASEKQKNASLAGRSVIE